MLPNRGMGGNMAMFDTAMAMPFICRLHEIAKVSRRASTLSCAAACREFEAEMIPRAFRWVEDSSGLKTTVSPVKSIVCERKLIFSHPFDTNKFFGKLFAFILNLSADLEELWAYVTALFRAFKIRSD